MIPANSAYVKLFLALLMFGCFGCKKKKSDDPEPTPAPQKTIKITYEISSSAPAFESNAYNNLMFNGAEGSFLFEIYKGSTWRKEVSIADNGTSSISLHMDLLLNGDRATATGKIYINDELKSIGNSTSPYYSNGRTQTILDVKYR